MLHAILISTCGHNRLPSPDYRTKKLVPTIGILSKPTYLSVFSPPSPSTAHNTPFRMPQTFIACGDMLVPLVLHLQESTYELPKNPVWIVRVRVLRLLVSHS